MLAVGVVIFGELIKVLYRNKNVTDDNFIE